MWGRAPVRTGDGEVALGARDGLPGPAQRQQQRRLGRVGEGPARVGAGGLTGTLAPDGCVPQQLGGPHRAPRLWQPLGGWLGLHGPLGTLPRPAPPWPVLRGDGHVHGAGGGPRDGRPQPVHRPRRRPRGVGGDGGAGLRGLRQLLQLPVGHCKGIAGTRGDTLWGHGELHIPPEDRGLVGTPRATGTAGLLAATWGALCPLQGTCGFPQDDGDQRAAGHGTGIFMSPPRMGTCRTLQYHKDHRAAGHGTGLFMSPPRMGDRWDPTSP